MIDESSVHHDGDKDGMLRGEQDLGRKDELLRDLSIFRPSHRDRDGVLERDLERDLESDLDGELLYRGAGRPVNMVSTLEFVFYFNK